MKQPTKKKAERRDGPLPITDGDDPGFYSPGKGAIGYHDNAGDDWVLVEVAKGGIRIDSSGSPVVRSEHLPAFIRSLIKLSTRA